MFFAITVIGNHSLFPLLFGAPLSILMQEELGFEPRGLGERFPLRSGADEGDTT